MKTILGCVGSILLLTLLSLDAWSSPCSRSLDPNQYFHAQENGKIAFGAAGGNGRSYPKDYTLEDFDLTERQIASMEGEVVLLGEGYGSLLPLFLGAPKVHVVAVDPIYALQPLPSGFMGEGLKQFISQYSSHLNAASSDCLPMSDSSVDLIFSHMLINNLLDVKKDEKGEDVLEFSQAAIDTIRESIRILKPGGKAVFVGYLDENDVRHLLEMVAANYHSPVAPRYHIDSKTFERTTDYRTFGTLAPDLQDRMPKKDMVSRLTIEKIK
jgi:SAM-dependent methyltransferase